MLLILKHKTIKIIKNNAGLKYGRREADRQGQSKAKRLVGGGMGDKGSCCMVVDSAGCTMSANR